MTLAGATVGWHTWMPSGSSYSSIAASFDAYVGRTAAQQAQKIYMNTGESFPTSIPSWPVSGTGTGIANELSYLKHAGASVFASLKPAYSTDPSVQAQARSDLAAFLTLLQDNGWTASTCWITLWQEPNLGITPGPPWSSPQEYFTNYIDVYGPTVRAKFPLLFDPALGGSDTVAQSYYPQGKVDGIVCDYYAIAYKNGHRLNWYRDQANTDGIMFGLGEFGEVGARESTGVTQAMWYTPGAGDGSYITHLIKTCQGATHGVPFLLAFNGLTVNPNNYVPSETTPYTKVPGYQALYDALNGTSGGGTSAAFTEVQDAGVTGAAGVLPLWFSQASGTASTAGNLLTARIVTGDGGQAITGPTGWVLRKEVTSGGGTGVARSQIWDYVSNPGGLCGNQSYTATNASPCVFTVTGAAPANDTQACLSGSVPTGFTASPTVYYVVSSSGSTFELAATLGGTAINSSSAVTTGGVLAFPQVWAYSNTTSTTRGRLGEYSAAGGAAITVDQVSAGATGQNAVTSLPVSCASPNALSGGLGIAAFAAHFSVNPSGQSWTAPSGWTADSVTLNGVALAAANYYQAGLAAGVTSATATVSSSSNMDSWTANLVTYSAATAAPDAPVVTTASVPNGSVSVTYSSVTFTETGGTSPFTWSKSAGTLPPGLSLAGAVLSGTPTTAGTYNFTIKVTDAASLTGTASYTVTIGTALSITTSSPLPGGTVNSGYSQALAASGGTPGYTWAKTTGTIPPGLALNAAGTLAGTPSLAGSYTIGVKVTDAAGITATASLDITIAAAGANPVITTLTLAAGDLGKPYFAQLTEAGGNPPYTWAVTAGALPPGLSLGASTGRLTGTPTVAGSYNFTITVTSS